MDINKYLFGTWSWKRFCISILSVYCILTAWLYFISDPLMFPYNQSSYGHELKGLSFIKTNDKTKIAMREWKSKDYTNLVLYFHGNYLDIGDLDDVAEKFNSLGYSVWAMDYRGYGLSEGKATEHNAYLDSQSLFDKAIKQGFKSDEIIIVGRSIGSGVAMELALNNESKALVLISPFVSAYRVITQVPLFMLDKFTNLSKIKNITEPMFIIHGNKDTVIKPWHSKLIYDNYNGLKQRYIVVDAGHNDIFDYNIDELIKQLDLFILEI